MSKKWGWMGGGACVIVRARHEASYVPSVRTHVCLLGSGALCNEGVEPSLGAQLQTTFIRSLAITYV